MPPSDRKKAPSYQDVMVAMLDPKAGLAELKAMKIVPSKHTLIRAVLELRRRGQAQYRDELMDFVAEAYPPKKQVDRRPKIGTTRDYKIWEQDGIAYCRIPVATLGVPVGGIVRVTFASDVITMREKQK